MIKSLMCFHLKIDTMMRCMRLCMERHKKVKSTKLLKSRLKFLVKNFQKLIHPRVSSSRRHLLIAAERKYSGQVLSKATSMQTGKLLLRNTLMLSLLSTSVLSQRSWSNSGRQVSTMQLRQRITSSLINWQLFFQSYSCWSSSSRKLCRLWLSVESISLITST